MYVYTRPVFSPPRFRNGVHHAHRHFSPEVCFPHETRSYYRHPAPKLCSLSPSDEKGDHQKQLRRHQQQLGTGDNHKYRTERRARTKADERDKYLTSTQRTDTGTVCRIFQFASYFVRAEVSLSHTVYPSSRLRRPPCLHKGRGWMSWSIAFRLASAACGELSSMLHFPCFLVSDRAHKSLAT
jgi:hypothetical protein